MLTLPAGRTIGILSGVALATMLLTVLAVEQPRVLARIAAPGGLGSATAEQTAPSPDPASAGLDPVIDEFQRDALGDNWQTYNGNAGIVNGELGIVNQSGPMLGLGIVAWRGGVFAADQFSEATIAPNKGPDALLQVFVRRRTSDAQRYGFHWNPDFGGRWELKLDGGQPGVVLTTQAAPQGPGPGDVMRVEVAGQQLRGFYNGALVLEAVDASLTDPGQPGLALNVGRMARFPVAFVTRWSGGSL